MLFYVSQATSRSDRCLPTCLCALTPLSFFRLRMTFHGESLLAVYLNRALKDENSVQVFWSHWFPLWDEVFARVISMMSYWETKHKRWEPFPCIWCAFTRDPHHVSLMYTRYLAHTSSPFRDFKNSHDATVLGQPWTFCLALGNTSQASQTYGWLSCRSAKQSG